MSQFDEYKRLVKKQLRPMLAVLVADFRAKIPGIEQSEMVAAVCDSVEDFGRKTIRESEYDDGDLMVMFAGYREVARELVAELWEAQT